MKKSLRKIIKERREEISKEIEYWKEHELIIDDKKLFFLTWKENGKNYVIDNYKDFFIHPCDKTKEKFLYNSNFRSLLELLKFDKKIISLMVNDILIIETCFSQTMFECIDKQISKFIKNLFQIKFKSFLGVHSIDYLFKYPNMKQIILKIFNKVKAKRKKGLYKFIKYLLDNYDDLKNLTIDEIFDKYKILIQQNNKRKIERVNTTKNKTKKSTIEADLNRTKVFFKDMFKIQNFKLTLTDVDNVIISKLIENKDNWYPIFISYFNDYCFDNIVNSFLYHLHNDKSKIKKCKAKNISDVYNNLPLGSYIKIFEALDSKMKNEIVDEMFELNGIDWDGDSNKTTLFVDIMWMISKIRNKACHKEPIYNFEYEYYFKENLVLFLSRNLDKESFSFINPNEVNLFVIVCCIDIFRRFENKNWNINKTELKKTLMNYKKFTKEIIPDKAKEKLRNIGLKLFDN